MHFIKVVNSDMRRVGEDVRRVWLETDKPIQLGPQLTFTAYFDIQDGERYLPYVRVRTPRADLRYDLPEGCLLDLGAWCGLKALPRAVEFGDSGRPTRMLVEFGAVNREAA